MTFLGKEMGWETGGRKVKGLLLRPPNLLQFKIFCSQHTGLFLLPDSGEGWEINPMVVLKLAYRWSFVKLRGIRYLDYFYICPLHLVGSYHILCKLPANKRWTECLMGLFGFRIRELWSLLDKVCQFDWHQKTKALQWVPVVLKVILTGIHSVQQTDVIIYKTISDSLGN